MTDDVSHILDVAAGLCGDRGKAELWFKTEPLTDYGGRTAAELCAGGRQSVVLAFLSEVENGANG